MINAKQKLEGTIVIGKPSSTVELLDVYGGYTLRVSDPNGIQEFTIGALKGSVQGDPPGRRLLLEDGSELPVMIDEKIRVAHLPDVTQEKKGAMLPEDKVILDTLAKRPSLAEYFDTVRSSVLYWNGETVGLEHYEDFYKVSDVAPKYGNLEYYPLKVTYKSSSTSSPSICEVSVIGDDSEGYCALGTVSTGPAGTTVYAYIAYEGNSLGLSEGTYLSKFYEVSMLDVGHPVYEKKTIKEDCLPDEVAESTEQVKNMLKFPGGDTLSWDGETSSLDTVDDSFYMVSSATPTYDELSKVDSATSYIKVANDRNYYSGSNLIVNDYIDTEGYCSIDTTGYAVNLSICKVYYNGNAAGVTPGTYFYADEDIYVDKLILEGYGKFVPILKEKSLPTSGATAGTYGGLDTEAGAYNIPNVTVDKYGRVIEASNSVLPKASAESDGYISADIYKKTLSLPIYSYESTLSEGASLSSTNYLLLVKTTFEPIEQPLRGEAWFYRASENKYYSIPIKYIESNTYEKSYYWHRFYVDTSVLVSYSIETANEGDKFILYTNFDATTSVM